MADLARRAKTPKEGERKKNKRKKKNAAKEFRHQTQPDQQLRFQSKQ